jgi:hypothetical protein
MTKLYRKLECNDLDKINQEILAHISGLEFTGTKFWNPIDTIKFIQATPMFVMWCKQNDLMIKTVSVTQGLFASCCGPHKDTPPCRFKLSWPVLNTQHTWNRWFRAPSNALIEINELGGTTYLDPTQLQEIDRMQVDQPALITVDVPHDVWFDPRTEYPRYGLQCQLFSEPDHL